MKPVLRRKCRIGLALGGGAARGWAHVGVLQALEEAGLEVACVAGTSAGAMVGAVYASGRLSDMETLAQQTDWRKVLYYFSDISFARAGLVDGDKVCRMLRKYISARNIEDLPLPFRAVATDIMTGEEVVLNRGEIIEAVRASISFPGIFTPVKIENRLLVDGGMVNPVPVSAVREMGADFVIAVDLNHDRMSIEARSQRETKISGSLPDARLPEPLLRLSKKLIEKAEHHNAKRRSMPHLFDILGNASRIMEGRLSDAMLRADPPDILIQPKVGHISFMEFNRSAVTIAAGYEAAIGSLTKAAERIRGVPLKR
ncbi:MAG: patatin-like phospholipase family protein [Kiritimatiellia bacterium]